MSMVSLESTKIILKKFNLFAELLENFSDSKKQIKYIKKMIFTYCLSIEEGEYLINEGEQKDIDYYMRGIKESVYRFYKAKGIDDYNRAKQLLDRYNLEISSAITKTDIKLAESKGRAVFGDVFDKAKSIGDMVNKGVDKIKDAVNKAKEELI